MFMVKFSDTYVYQAKVIKLRYGLHPKWKLDVSAVMFQIVTDLRSDPILTLGFIIGDMPERRHLTGMMGQTAREACEWCMGRAALAAPTSWTYSEAKNYLRVWRTHESYKDPNTQGMNRVSPLASLDEVMPFSIPTNIPIDIVSGTHLELFRF